MPVGTGDRGCFRGRSSTHRAKQIICTANVAFGTYAGYRYFSLFLDFRIHHLLFYSRAPGDDLIFLDSLHMQQKTSARE